MPGSSAVPVARTPPRRCPANGCGAGWLVEVEDHSAPHVEIRVRLLHAGAQTRPHRLDRYAEPDHEAGREEHLAVTHSGRDRVFERLVGNAPEVIGRAQALADHV